MASSAQVFRRTVLPWHWQHFTQMSTCTVKPILQVSCGKLTQPVSKIVGLVSQRRHSVSQRFSSTVSAHKIIAEEDGQTIIQSPYQDIEHCSKPFGEFMLSFLDEFKKLEMMVDYPTGRVYTGQKIKEQIIKVAGAIKKMGLRRGDVILLFSSNCPEYVVTFIACATIGVTVSTANPVYTPGELARQLGHSETKAVFTRKAMLPTVREALKLDNNVSKRVKNIILFDGEADKCRPFINLLDEDFSSFPENIDINAEETILTLPYSSGTTGLPKGVMLSHTNMVMNLLQGKLGQMRFRTGEEVLMGLLPFYHIYGMMVLQFGSITQGAKLIIHPKFEPELFLQSLQQYKISYAHLVPPVVLFLTKHALVDNYTLSSLKTIVSAAAPLGEGVTRELEDRLKCNLLQAYGLTECSPLTHYDEYPHRRGTIGRLVPSTRAKVIDPLSGEVLKPGKTGEILLQGPQVMMGYLKNKEATDKTIQNGWLYTGDIGHVDFDGYFTISDRIKELIKYKGYQVAPAELEALLCTHPKIEDAAVVGIKAGEDVGEVPKAFVVVKSGEKISAEDIMKFVEGNVSPYKKLRGGVEVIDQIPKTASGKILRRLLKEK